MLRVYTYDERRAMVVQVFQWGGKLTVYDVAKVLGITPSKQLYKILDDLVGEGALVADEVQHRSNRSKFIYHDPSKI